MIDQYTKLVLTVIAAALTVIAVHGFTVPTNARSQEPMKVQICDALSGCMILFPYTRTFRGRSVTSHILPVAIQP